MSWTQVRDFCHVPLTVGALCTAQVDKGSNATLVWTCIVPVGASVEATTVHLRTVTGDLAPIPKQETTPLASFTVCVSDVQDECTLDLDFCAVCCVLDVKNRTLSLPGGAMCAVDFWFEWGQPRL